MHHLHDILVPNTKSAQDQFLTLNLLRQMNTERKSRQQGKQLSKRSVMNNAAKDYIEILTNYSEKPMTCMHKLTCMNKEYSSVAMEKCSQIKC